MSAQPYTLHIAETPEPRKFYMLMRPGISNNLYSIYQTPEQAEIARAYKAMDLPELGPWEVVELVEVLP